MNTDELKAMLDELREENEKLNATVTKLRANEQYLTYQINDQRAKIESLYARIRVLIEKYQHERDSKQAKIKTEKELKAW